MEEYETIMEEINKIKELGGDEIRDSFNLSVATIKKIATRRLSCL